MVWKRRLWAAALAIVLSLAAYPMVGAGAKLSDDEMVSAAVEKLKKAKSMQAGLRMDLGIEVLGVELEAQASIKMASDSSPMQLQTVVGTDLGFLGEHTASFYGCEKNEKYYLYTKEEKKWVKEEITFAEWNCFNGQYLASVFLEQIEEPKLQGTQKVNGKSAYKYNGVIKKEGLQKIILDAKCLELLAKGFQGGLLKTVGSLLTQEDKISSLTEKSEDLKVSVWIDKETGYPILCAMDVGEMLNDSFGRLTGRIGSEEDKSTSNKVSLWSGVMITEAKIMIQCGEFK